MQSLRILHTLLTYCFEEHVDACRNLPFGLLRRRGHFSLGKFIVLNWLTTGLPRQKPHLQCGVFPCEEKSTALYNVKRNKNSYEGPQSLIVLRCGLFTCSYVVLLEAVSIPRMLQFVAFDVRQVVRPWPVAFGHWERPFPL